ncbi:porin, partial [Pseudomonas sp. MWU13-2625]
MNQPNGRADRLAVPLAALLACAALPAFAQSSVTLYGRVDTAIEYANAGPNHVTRMGSGNLFASQWGLKGVEDLGGGLKAVFRLESGIDLANGASDDGPDSIFGRRATVGLKGKWGEISLGRNFTVTYDYMLPFDPMGYSQN